MDLWYQFTPFMLDSGGTDLKRIEFTQPGEENQALMAGAYHATVEVQRDLTTDWEPLLDFDFEITDSPTTQDLGQNFGYEITGMRAAD